LAQRGFAPARLIVEIERVTHQATDTSPGARTRLHEQDNGNEKLETKRKVGPARLGERFSASTKELRKFGAEAARAASGLNGCRSRRRAI
jgi:hypothetical protein